jgi:ketosteroid isomerase-like protein
MATVPTGVEETIALVKRFEESFNRHDPDALMADMTEDCVFEHVAPEGKSFGRHEGQEAVRAVWASLPNAWPGYRFETEDMFAAEDRCAYRFIIRWNPPEGGQASVRGVDIFTIRGGKIAEKYTYMTL